MTLLREERERRGWNRPKLVRELERLATAEGTYLAASDSLVRMTRRWEASDGPPDEPYRTLLCKLFGRTGTELGWSHSATRLPTNAGLSYAASLEITVDSIVTLSSEDVGANQALIAAPYDPKHLTAAALDWLFADVRDEAAVDGGQPVTSADVAEVREMTKAFDALDRQVGGDRSRHAAAQYLRDRVVPRVRNAPSSPVGREFFSAAAILCELIGWMAYDAGRHSAAQRYFVQALRMSASAGDRGYGAYVLASMSDQALFLHHSEEALRLARAARESFGGRPTVLAEATMLEARALAQMGAKSECAEALHRAERAFESIRPDDRPEWSSDFNEIVFASHAGTCWVDLGVATEATAHIESVLDQMRGQARRRVYGTIQLAKVAILERDFEQACALGDEAIDAISGLASYRSTNHLVSLGGLLREQKGPRVREFLERLSTVTPASA